MSTEPKKPGDFDRAAGPLDDFADLHGGGLSGHPTPCVKPVVGHSDANVCESVNIADMVQKPRKSRRVKSRGAFGERLRELRLARDITQMELAVEIGISRSHVASMETGADPPGREIMHALASFFGVTMDFLQAGITNAPKEGRFVQDADHLALLELWDRIPASERPRIARMLRAAAFDRTD